MATPLQGRDGITLQQEDTAARDFVAKIFARRGKS